MAGTIVTTSYVLGHIKRLSFACTADASDGSFPETTLPAIEGQLLHLSTNPGSTGPTSNYDVGLDDQNDHDVLEGVGANRHTSNSEKAHVVYSGTGSHPVIHALDTLTLKITNNSVNSATTAVDLVYSLIG